MPQPKRGTLVIVRWRDSARFPSGWTFEADAHQYRKPGVGESVGWLYSEPGEDLVLIPHRMDAPDDPEQRNVMGGLAIPKEAVVSVKRLKE